MGGLLLSSSPAPACLPGPGDCIISEDEVILQHKGGTGAKTLIRTGLKTLAEHVNVLPNPKKLSHDRQKYLCCSYFECFSLRYNLLFLRDLCKTHTHIFIQICHDYICISSSSTAGPVHSVFLSLWDHLVCDASCGRAAVEARTQ